MYTTMVDEREFAIKPMNCPGAMLVYNSTLHSYKDLPLRMGELGQVHRHEASGALNGLFRVRTFTQDDAHLFMRPDQVEEEVKRLIAFIDRMYSIFGLTYDMGCLREGAGRRLRRSRQDIPHQCGRRRVLRT